MSPTTTPCPDQSVLLALAAEDVAAPEDRSHVAACPSCRRTLRRLRAEVVHLRSTAWAERPPPPTGQTPLDDPPDE